VNLAPLFATALSVVASLHTVNSNIPNSPSVSAATASIPAVGEAAPEFDYLSSDYLRTRLSDVLREQGSVLLVFASDESSLRETESHEAALHRAGIVPVVLVELPPHQTRDLVDRMGLGFGVLSDPAGFVASQYGVTDARGWFVIDRSGRVRASGRESIGDDALTAIATGVLVAPEVRASR
jgi:peroxiredoxin